MNEKLINSFSLVGNVAKVNEIKEQTNGTKYRYFTLCQNNKYKNKNGDEIDQPNYFDIKIFEKHFDKFESNLEVGKFINVFGKINVYKDNNNQSVLTLIGSDSRSITKEKTEFFDYDWLND